MGIQGLLPVCKHVISPCSLKEYKNKNIAIDGYSWLHKAIYSCCVELALKHTDSRSKKWISYCLNLIDMILYYDIKIYMIFDGSNLPAKALTEQNRAIERFKNYEKGLVALKECNNDYNNYNVRMYFSRSIDVNPEMAAEFIQILRTTRKNVEIIVAPYEADAQLAYLSIYNIVDAVISEDSDTIPYGCKHVLYKLNNTIQGMCERIIVKDLLTMTTNNTNNNTVDAISNVNVYESGSELITDKKNNNSKKLKNNNNLNIDCSQFTQDMIVTMCIAAGCDYLASVKNFGIKKSYKYVAKYKDAIKLLRGMRLEGLLPTDLMELENPDKNSDNNLDKNRILQYEWDFYKAILTYYHQTVYDPRSKRMVSLYPMEYQLNTDTITTTPNATNTTTTNTTTTPTNITCPSNISPIIQNLMESIYPHKNKSELYGFLGRIHPDSKICQGIADGLLHPNTYEPFQLSINMNANMNTTLMPTHYKKVNTHKKHSISKSPMTSELDSINNMSMYNSSYTPPHIHPVSTIKFKPHHPNSKPNINSNSKPNSMIQYMRCKSSTAITHSSATSISLPSQAKAKNEPNVPTIVKTAISSTESIQNTSISSTEPIQSIASSSSSSSFSIGGDENKFEMFGLFQKSERNDLESGQDSGFISCPPDIYEIEDSNSNSNNSNSNNNIHVTESISMLKTKSPVLSNDNTISPLQDVTGVRRVPMSMNSGILIPKSTKQSLFELSQTNIQQAAERLLASDSSSSHSDKDNDKKKYHMVVSNASNGKNEMKIQQLGMEVMDESETNVTLSSQTTSQITNQTTSQTTNQSQSHFSELDTSLNTLNDSDIDILDISFYSGGISNIDDNDMRKNDADMTDMESSENTIGGSSIINSGNSSSNSGSIYTNVANAPLNMSEFRLRNQKHEKIVDKGIHCTTATSKKEMATFTVFQSVIKTNNTKNNIKTKSKTKSKTINNTHTNIKVKSTKLNIHSDEVTTNKKTNPSRNYFDAFKCKTDTNNISFIGIKKQKTILQTINGNTLCATSTTSNNNSDSVSKRNNSNITIVIEDNSNS